MVEYTNHCRYGAKIKMADIIANRFAAELLVGKKALKERWDDLSNRYNLCVKSVILSGEFLVPYRTIVKRLVETGIVTSDDKMNKLLDIQETEIKQIADRYECCNRNYDISKTKHLGGYINKALTMYENNLSTYDDLCKKLALIGKTPEDFDIQYYDLDLSEFILRASEEPETEYGENG
jgi:Zn-dependent peptidase ImmA (M78 family)